MTRPRSASPSRRRFVLAGSGACLAVWPALAFGSTSDGPTPTTTPATRRRPDKGPPLADDLVRGFVGAAHGDLDRTRRMLQQHPTLINATWDWGGGDFETALGGASHMGRPDIATFLLERGARLDLFAAAMLGKLAIVREACEAFPAAPRVPGPHGIPLIEHARKGGEPASAVVQYLESLA